MVSSCCLLTIHSTLLVVTFTGQRKTSTLGAVCLHHSLQTGLRQLQPPGLLCDLGGWACLLPTRQQDSSCLTYYHSCFLAQASFPPRLIRCSPLLERPVCSLHLFAIPTMALLTFVLFSTQRPRSWPENLLSTLKCQLAPLLSA